MFSVRCWVITVILAFAYSCTSKAQFSILPKIPIFNFLNNGENQAVNIRPKKSPKLDCCELVQISSRGVGNDILPGRLGVYKLINQKLSKSSTAYYKHLRSQSFLFRWSFPEGDRWVIGDDASKNSFVISSSSTIQKTKYHSCPAITGEGESVYSNKRPGKITERNDIPFTFQVWDGQHFLLDDQMKISCLTETNKYIDGCCSTVRLASASKDSLSMEYQRRRMGLYKVIGSMNERLVYEKQGNPSDEPSYIYFWKMDSEKQLWFIGTNFSSSNHGIESTEIKASSHPNCVTDVNFETTDEGQGNFKVFSRSTPGVLDPLAGWLDDFTLRAECFDFTKTCCSSVEVTSNGIASELYPEEMGTYKMVDQITLSGRRSYKQAGRNNFIYLYDSGPGIGMRWVFGSFLGEENGFIRSENIENSHPLNVCLYDAVQVGQFQVWDEPKWKKDTTLKIQCTYYY